MRSEGVSTTIKKQGSVEADELRQQVFVPRASNDPLSGRDRLEQLELGLADEPYSISKDDKRSWIAEAVREAYPNHFAWASVGDEYVVEKDGKVLGDYETETSVAMFILLNTHG